MRAFARACASACVRQCVRAARCRSYPMECTHARTHICTHARTHKCMHTWTHSCTHVQVGGVAARGVYGCERPGMHTRMPACMCVCTHPSMYAHAHIYTHTAAASCMRCGSDLRRLLPSLLRCRGGGTHLVIVRLWHCDRWLGFHVVACVGSSCLLGAFSVRCVFC